MIVTYFRSSSYNAWDFCPMSYYLTYNLGLKPNEVNKWKTPKPHKKGQKGNIVHKALELLAHKKLAEQEGRTTFKDGEVDIECSVTNFNIDKAISMAWDTLTHPNKTVFEWDSLDLQEVRKWTYAVANFSNGHFNPLKRKIVWPEKYFDFTIDAPWAKYKYELAGEVVEGQLGLKGTMDLTVGVDGFDDSVELIDWKTGERKDWASGKRKEWKDLRKDPQLRLYHYALSKLLPNKNILITIVWIRDGGPYSLDFGPEDLVKTELMLRRRFEEIKDCVRPYRIIKDRNEKWKCGKLCVFGMNDWLDTGKTVCNHMHNQIVQIGLDKVTAKFSNNRFNNYGDGGGRSEK